LASIPTKRWSLAILNLDNNDDLYNHEGKLHPLPYHRNEVLLHKSHDASLKSLRITCGLIGILGIHHSERPFPATYVQGRKRIDYMLVSAPLQTLVIRS
jgi:hypothetical protein